MKRYHWIEFNQFDMEFNTFIRLARYTFNTNDRTNLNLDGDAQDPQTWPSNVGISSFKFGAKTVNSFVIQDCIILKWCIYSQRKEDYNSFFIDLDET